MSAKFSIWFIAKRHFKTYVDNASGEVRRLDVVSFVFFPAACGVAAAFLDLQLQCGSSLLVTGVSMLTAFMCATAVMVFQLRVQIAASKDRLVTAADKSLLDDTFFNILWAIVTGLVIAAVLVSLEYAGWFGSEDLLFAKVAGGIVIALSLHFLLTVLMVLYRLARSYYVIGMRRH